MADSQEHWNKVFAEKIDPELGWYESDVTQTLKFLDKIPQTQGATVFVPGAGTSVLVDQLQQSGFRIILNDISNEALDRLEQRIGRNEESLIWLHHDISKPLPDDLPKADIWIDRAVLHFLLDEAQIRQYFSNLNSALKPGGYALLAEFSISGAKMCAGLDVHRYSLEELTRRMGNGFELVAHENYRFLSPSGNERPYIYALYRKVER